MLLLTEIELLRRALWDQFRCLPQEEMNHTLQVLISLSYLSEEPKVPRSDPDVYTDESHPQGHGENNENLQA